MAKKSWIKLYLQNRQCVIVETLKKFILENFHSQLKQCLEHKILQST